MLKANIILLSDSKDNNSIFTFPHQSKTQYLVLFFYAYWCSKSPFSESWRRRCILGWRIVRLVRYIGSYGISPFSPSIEITSVSPKRKINSKRKINWIIQIIQILEREMQLDPLFFFWGGNSDYFQLIEFMVVLVALIKSSIQAPFR